MTGSQAAEPTTSRTDSAPWLVVAGALAVGVLLGFSGNFVPPGDVQNLMYVVSAAGLIVGALVLAMQLASRGDRVAAAAFVLLGLGESRLLLPTGVPGGEAAFAGGVLLYVPALVLLAWTGWAPLWARTAGVASAAFFAAHSLMFFAGSSVDPAGPLAGIGYALFSLTVLGWIATVLRLRTGAGVRR